MRRLLALLCTVAPFVAGTIAWASARRDTRMLGMALGATAVVRVVVGVAGTRHRVWGAVVAFATASGAAAAVAVLAGARAVFGVVAVAGVLAGCATAGALLGARPRRTA